MEIVAGETEVRLEVTTELCSRSVRIVIVARTNRTGTVSEFAKRAKMVFRIIITTAVYLLSLRIKSIRYVVISISFFARLSLSGATYELLCIGDIATILLDDLISLTQTVVSKFTPMYAVI